MAEIHDWKKLGLQRGDTILCAGNSKMSKGIQKFQKYTGADKESRHISHVAKFWDLTGITREYRPSVFESTSLNKWAGKSGVQINPFQEWLDNYDGGVFIRKWDFERTLGYYVSDDMFIDGHEDDPYESGIPGSLELLLCGLRLHRAVRWAFPDYTPKFTTEPHCTELIGLNKQEHTQMIYSAVANRLPPWMWWGKIDKFVTVPISKPIQIK